MREWISDRFVLKQQHFPPLFFPGGSLRIHRMRGFIMRVLRWIASCLCLMPKRLAGCRPPPGFVSIDPAQEAAGAEVPYSVGGGKDSPDMSFPDSAD
jgi:hypothetical protein